MKGHIIPQVYQKKWHSSKGENNVFYYDKNNLSSPICKDGGNVENNLYEIDEYIINEKDKSYGLFCIDDYELEHYFDKDYENQWNSIVIESSITEWLEDKRENKHVNNIIAISRNDLKGTPFELKLLKYVILQFFRVFNNFKSIDKGLIDKLTMFSLSKYEEITGQKITDDEKNQMIGNDNYKRTIWKQLLLDCKNENNSSSILSVILEGLKDTNLTFIYIGKNNSSRFILSDNPVIWNCGSEKNYINLESGIFFPILPNLMIAYLQYPTSCNVKQGDAICLFGNEDFIKYMNHILLYQSLRTIGYMTMNVKDSIDGNIDFSKVWSSMLE